LSHNNISLRKTDGLIESLLFSTFHGGSNPSWTPMKDGKPVTVHAYFDNFSVYKGRKITP